MSNTTPEEMNRITPTTKSNTKIGIENEVGHIEFCYGKFKNEIIKEHVTNLRLWYNKKATKNKRWFLVCSIVTIVVPLISTFLMIIDTGQPCIKIISAILALCASFFAALIPLFRFHDHWTRYRSTEERIKHESIAYLAKTGHYSNTDADEKFIDFLNDICCAENRGWLQAVNHAGNKDQSMAEENNKEGEGESNGK